MYRANPFTYLVDGLLSSSLANAPVTCASNEYLQFESPANMTCGEYMQAYMSVAGGYVRNPNASWSSNGELCEFCPMSSTNAFLSSINVSFANRWRNFGLLWVFVAFNTLAAVFFYWVFRVPKKNRRKKEKKD
jgi:ABC-type multidrug transport system permease subunit